MTTKTSKRWYDSYKAWGGDAHIFNPIGWDQRNHQKSWYKEEITAEEFLRRFKNSEFICTALHYQQSGMNDVEYYFSCVMYEDDDA